MFSPLVLCLAVFFSSLVHAVPFDRRDVWSPKITSPNAKSVWAVGTKQTVVWDTSNKPAQVTNPIGRVILGHEENGSLNLQLDNPLAQGFNLTDGKVQITVPNVPSREDYIVVLMGDSGNTSPTFAITAITGGSSSSASSRSDPTSASISAPAPESSQATSVTNLIPISGTTITGGTNSSIPPASSITDSQAPSPTATSPTSAGTTSTSVAVSTSTSTTAASSSSSGSGSTSGTASNSAAGAQSTSGAISSFHIGSSFCLGMLSLAVALAI